MAKVDRIVSRKVKKLGLDIIKIRDKMHENKDYRKYLHSSRSNDEPTRSQTNQEPILPNL